MGRCHSNQKNNFHHYMRHENEPRFPVFPQEMLVAMTRISISNYDSSSVCSALLHGTNGSLLRTIETIPHTSAQDKAMRRKFFFRGPSGVMISRPCRTSYQSSPSSAIPCFPRDSLHVFRHPFCDVKDDRTGQNKHELLQYSVRTINIRSFTHNISA